MIHVDSVFIGFLLLWKSVRQTARVGLKLPDPPISFEPQTGVNAARASSGGILGQRRLFFADRFADTDDLLSVGMCSLCFYRELSPWQILTSP